jgi:Immunity protein 49
MSVARHTIDLEHAHRLFSRNQRDFPRFLDNARSSADPSDILPGIAVSYVCSGAVLAPDSPEVGLALRVAAQAHTALIMFDRVYDPPRYIHLGDGPSVTYTVPAHESYVNAAHWLYAFMLANITRDREVLGFLQEVPSDLFRQSSTVAGQSAYDEIEAYRDLLSGLPFTQGAAFRAYESYMATAAQERTARAKSIRLQTLPYIQTLKSLDAGDFPGFNEALTQALLGHKKYWSSSEKLRQTPDGWVSISLTAVAAIAYDRGMKIEVESDYMPASWVRGDLFRIK